MKKLAAMVLAALVLSSISGAQLPAPVRLAVLDLKSPGNEGVVLGDRLYAEFTKTGLYEMISRERRDAAVKELGIAASDDPANLIKLGQRLKADKVVGGSVGQLGNTWSLNLLCVDVASGRTEQQLTKSVAGKVDALLALAEGFVKQASAERAKQMKGVMAEKEALGRRSEALKAKKAELEKKREQVKADLQKELESIDKKQQDLDKQYQLTGEKIAVQDKKIEEVKTSGKKPATDPAKVKAQLEKKQQDILKSKDGLDGDREKARARAAKAEEELSKEIALVEKEQEEVARKLAAFEPKPPEPEPEPAPAVQDTVKKEPPKKPLPPKVAPKTKPTAPNTGGKAKAKSVE